MNKPGETTGKRLNDEWKVGAVHSLYNYEGKWYHYLEHFPGALFDSNGYILFQTEEDYHKCESLSFGEHVHVAGDGISSIPGYKKVKAN